MKKMLSIFTSLVLAASAIVPSCVSAEEYHGMEMIEARYQTIFGDYDFQSMRFGSKYTGFFIIEPDGASHLICEGLLRVEIGVDDADAFDTDAAQSAILRACELEPFGEITRDGDHYSLMITNLPRRYDIYGALKAMSDVTSITEVFYAYEDTANYASPITLYASHPLLTQEEFISKYPALDLEPIENGDALAEQKGLLGAYAYSFGNNFSSRDMKTLYDDLRAMEKDEGGIDLDYAATEIASVPKTMYKFSINYYTRSSGTVDVIPQAEIIPTTYEDYLALFGDGPVVLNDSIVMTSDYHFTINADKISVKVASKPGTELDLTAVNSALRAADNMGGNTILKKLSDGEYELTVSSFIRKAAYEVLESVPEVMYIREEHLAFLDTANYPNLGAMYVSTDMTADEFIEAYPGMELEKLPQLVERSDEDGGDYYEDITIPTGYDLAFYLPHKNGSYAKMYAWLKQLSDDGVEFTFNAIYTELAMFPTEKYTFTRDIYTAVSDISGDANGDFKVNMADCVMIMQNLANPEGYPLSGQNRKNADFVGGDGVTNNDALAIQRYEAGLSYVTE